jgi:hypothetical protein
MTEGSETQTATGVTDVIKVGSFIVTQAATSGL